MRIMTYAVSLICAAVVAAPVLAEGDLAIRPEKLPDFVVGLGDTGYGVSEKEYHLETGKAYQLMVQSTGNKECALRGQGFFSNIWLRKVEVGDVEIKAPFLTELEFERAGEAELFFVPVRPGSFELACAGLEERDVKTTIHVK